MARSGHTEAIHHFSVALDLLSKLGEKPGRAAKELELCVKLGPALMMVRAPDHRRLMRSTHAPLLSTRARTIRLGSKHYGVATTIQ